MDGVPGQCFPSRSSDADQMRARRARLISPPSTPHQNVLGSRFLRHASRNGCEEPSSVIGAENVPQDGAGRQLKFGDVLIVFARLLASHEVRAALPLVEELVSSDVDHSELISTLVMFHRQSGNFAKKYSNEVSKIASEVIQRGGREESSTKIDIKAGQQGTKTDDLATSTHRGPNLLPDGASDFVQRGGHEESGTETSVKARWRATKSGELTDSTLGGRSPVPDRASDFVQPGGLEERTTEAVVQAGMVATGSDESKASARSASEAGSSMRRSVIQLCRRARDLTRRASKVTSVSSMSERQNREAFPSELKSSFSGSLPSGAHSRAPRYACTNIMIEASNRQRQARGQSFDGVVTSERSTVCHDR